MIVAFEQKDQNLGVPIKLGILMQFVFGLAHGRVLQEHLKSSNRNLAMLENAMLGVCQPDPF